MQYESYKIKDGVELCVIVDKKFKTNTVSITFIGDTGSRAASDYALLSGVLSRSCRAYPSLKQLNIALDGLYDAQLSADTSRCGLSQLVTFSIRSLDNRYSIDGTDIASGALDVLYSILFDPDVNGESFSAEVFQSEREQLKDAINGIRNMRQSYAVMQCTKELMRREPRFSPRLGTVADADSATPSEIYEVYKNVLSACPVRICAVLSDGADRVKEFACKVAERIGERKNGNAVTPDFSAPPKRLRRITEDAPIKQDVICVGCDLDCDESDGKEAERALFNEIFFQNPTSRLFENVREKLSLCYYVSASPMTDLKKFVIYAGVDGKNAKKAESEIRSQLELMKRGVSAEELKRCRLTLKNDLLSITDSPSRLSRWYLIRALRGLPAESVDEYISRLDRVTADDTARAAFSVLPDTVYHLKGGAANEI